MTNREGEGTFYFILLGALSYGRVLRVSQLVVRGGRVLSWRGEGVHMLVLA